MILGTMAIDGRFPLWKQCCNALTNLADETLVLMDQKAFEADKRDIKQTVSELQSMCGVDRVLIREYDWNRWNWREIMLREADLLQPEIILCPDQDEQFSTGFWDDIRRSRESDALGLMFGYHAPLPTCDGVDPCAGAPYPTYPGLPHMKAYKWRAGLTYENYTGFARVTNYAEPKHHMAAESKIMHYCAWNEEMRKGKDWKW